MAADRIFKKGETVHLRVRVSLPGTRTPANPTQGVTLAGLSRDGLVVPVTSTAFVLLTDGLYELVIPTALLATGVYSWLARAVNGPQAVALTEDTFVLVDPETVLAP